MAQNSIDTKEIPLWHSMSRSRRLLVYICLHALTHLNEIKHIAGKRTRKADLPTRSFKMNVLMCTQLLCSTSSFSSAERPSPMGRGCELPATSPHSRLTAAV